LVVKEFVATLLPDLFEDGRQAFVLHRQGNVLGITGGAYMQAGYNKKRCQLHN
jgi:hypothetical protein